MDGMLLHTSGIIDSDDKYSNFKGKANLKLIPDS